MGQGDLDFPEGDVHFVENSAAVAVGDSMDVELC